MPRANSTVPRHRRHRKIIKQAKGYYGTRKSNYRTAKDAVQKAWQYSYRDRRVNKRNFRRLWIIRINAAARQYGLSYSQFISALKENNIDTIIDDTDENFSSKMKKFNLIGIPFKIMIGKKTEGDTFEFSEVGKESQNLKIEKIAEIINSKK